MSSDEETGFVQILFSNASMKEFPTNKPQHFKVQLPQHLDLHGIWSVGLKAIQYPNNWYSLQKDCKFTYKSAPSDEFKIELKDIPVTAGQYEDIPQLCETMTKALTSAYSKAKETGKIESATSVKIGNTFIAGFDFKKFEQKVEFVSELPGTYVEFEKKESIEILNLLGLYPDNIIKNGKMGAHDATIKMHFPALFVYTPIIQYSGVGDTLAPLLAMVPVTGRHKEYIFERYERPLFHRLAHNQISVIEILITSDTGQPIAFLSGKVTLILEFRRQA